MLTLTNSSSAPSSVDKQTMLGRVRLSKAAFSRLSARAHLHSLASELFAGWNSLEPENPGFFVGEFSQGTICSPGTKSEVTHECGSSTFDCKNDFDCKLLAFDCGDFNCGDPSGSAGSFGCDSKYDFLCGGSDFDCSDDFDCTGGHVFMCFDDHECVDDFNCSAGGTACDAGHPYSLPDGGGSDTTPGDFLCGYGTDKNSFDCSGDFECASKDEFDCRANADFDCGTGQGSDSFNCGKDTKFECDTDFQCSPTSSFDCKGSYTPPPPPPPPPG